MDEYAKIIEQARRMGARALHLSGGEPTLYPKLEELVGLGNRAGMFVVLNTNGSLITEELAGRLLSAGLNSVIISIHSPIDTIHDGIKGRPGSLGEVLRSLAIFRKLKRDSFNDFLLTTQTIVSRVNYRRLDGVIDLACGYDVDGHGVSYLEGCADGNLRMRSEDIEELRREVIPRTVKTLKRHSFGNPLLRYAAIRLIKGLYARDNGDLSGTPAHGRKNGDLGAPTKGSRAGGRKGRVCRTPSVFAMVLREGSVLPCNMVEYAGGPIMGNVKEESLEQIVGGLKWKEFEREGFELCQDCPAHRHFHIPLSIGLGKLLRLGTRNPAEEQKSALTRVMGLFGEH